MPLVLAGASDCSTGLAKRVYDQLLGDTARNGLQGNTPPADWHDIIRAICYAAAKGVADEVNARSSRATAAVTGGAPGSVALAGAAEGISGVSLETVNAFRCVRFTFATAMTDTDYVAVPCEDFSAGLPGNSSRALYIAEKAEGYVSIGWYATGSEAFDHIDGWSHRVAVLVVR
jgi:hypothetical protein